MTTISAAHFRLGRLAASLTCAAFALAACAKQPSPAPSDMQPPPPATEAAPTPAQSIDVPAGAYTLDKSHASLVFRVDHLGFSNYTARFKTFDAQLQFDPQDFAASSATVTVDPKSLDIDNPPAGFLDELIGKNWLDAGQYREIVFRSTSVTDKGNNTMSINGDLTLHGVTKPIVLEATLNGGYAGHPMDPHARIGFSAHGVFKRSDFGIAYGVPAPGTKMGVGDDVHVSIESEFSGPAWTPPADSASPQT